jgi:hypothetical protein
MKNQPKKNKTTLEVKNHRKKEFTLIIYNVSIIVYTVYNICYYY